MRNVLYFIVLCSVWVITAAAGNNCPLLRIEPERLPDLIMPRAGHSMFYADGELTVVGGHTTGFKPTPTAEYYKDGKWNQLQTVYTHDNGFAVVLKSDSVLIGGGHNEPIGIGQTYLVEWYSPKEHTFSGFGCLDRKRTLAQAIELDSGKVVITGNHFEHDGIEMFDGHKAFSFVKDVTTERTCPYIFRMSGNDVMILGANDNHYRPLDSIIIDRMKGGPFKVPLLEMWHPLPFERSFNSNAGFIGNEQKGDWSYLLPVVNSSNQLAIALVRDTAFTMLPTSSAIPMAPLGDSIFYDSPAIADRQAQCAYVVGRDKRDRYYFLSIGYAQTPATLKLYYTEPMHDMGCTIPVLTADGNLIITGGVNQKHDNFDPLATVWLVHVNGKPAQEKSGFPVWLWLLIIMFIGTVVTFWLVKVHYKGLPKPTKKDELSQTSSPSDEDVEDSALLQRICQLMDEEQLYLRSNLKVQDVAVLLNTNSSYVSEIINSRRNQTFSQFVNTYRIRHAQTLLRQQSDMKTSNVAAESGFSTEASFFRNFKAVTGMTPREWLHKSTQN